MEKSGLHWCCTFPLKLVGRGGMAAFVKTTPPHKLVRCHHSAADKPVAATHHQVSDLTAGTAVEHFANAELHGITEADFLVANEEGISGAPPSSVRCRKTALLDIGNTSISFLLIKSVRVAVATTMALFFVSSSQAQRGSSRSIPRLSKRFGGD
jgi:hypothetical protein